MTTSDIDPKTSQVWLGGIHCAMRAAYTLFHVEKPIPPMYHGIMDPKVGLKALESALN